MRTKHYDALDGIRGLAVLMVFFYHSLYQEILRTSFAWRGVAKIAGMGWAGVDLFFALSGFLITQILLEAKEAPNYYRVFYVRRALRIAPLYYLVVASVLLFGPQRYSLTITWP